MSKRIFIKKLQKKKEKCLGTKYFEKKNKSKIGKEKKKRKTQKEKKKTKEREKKTKK